MSNCYCDPPRPYRCWQCQVALDEAKDLYDKDAPMVECESADELWDWVLAEFDDE